MPDILNLNGLLHTIYFSFVEDKTVNCYYAFEAETIYLPHYPISYMCEQKDFERVAAECAEIDRRDNARCLQMEARYD